MDEQKKTFDEVSIVIMVLLALGNDGAEIFFDLLAATVIGLPGEAIMEPVNLALDGVFTVWFFAKCGFGVPSVLQLLDDGLQLVGVPGRTICVIAGILIANNPKFKKIAEAVAAVEGGGVAGEIKGAGGAAQAEGVVAKETKLGAGGVKTEEGVPVGAEGGTGRVEEERKRVGAAPSEGRPETGGEEGGKEKTQEELDKEAREKKAEEEMRQPGEVPPMEALQQETLEQTPQAPGQETEEGEEVSSGSQPRQPISIEDIKRIQAAKTKEGLEHPKAPHDVTQENTEENKKDVDLPRAA